MHGLRPIVNKELADHFSSYRFVLLFALIAMVSLLTVYTAAITINRDLAGVAKPRFVFLMLFTSSGVKFSLTQFVAFFGPLIGLILGFDMINRERNEGTLSKLLAQPIYRDTVVNGKFLAGVTVISIMLVAIVLLVTGLGLVVVGVKPGGEEVGRIVLYLLLSILYISFWLGVAILFSIVCRNVATSALAALAAWLFFSFFIQLGATIVANALTPDADRNPLAMLEQAKIERAVSLVSPMELYTSGTLTIINPMRRTTRSFIQMGAMEQMSLARFSGPLPLGQSVMVVLPYIITLIALTAVCFAVSYTIFMRQEIRSI
jgi:ABC-2 type transport system permease protein